MTSKYVYGQDPYQGIAYTNEEFNIRFRSNVTSDAGDIFRRGGVMIGFNLELLCLFVRIEFHFRWRHY